MCECLLIIWAALVPDAMEAVMTFDHFALIHVCIDAELADGTMV